MININALYVLVNCVFLNILKYFKYAYDK